MINAIWGIAQTPLKRDKRNLSPTQQACLNIINIHAQ